MKSSAIAVVLFAASSGALADWQYAKFGMTVDQVVVASAGKARAEEYPDHDLKPQGESSPIAKALARSEFSFNGLDFSVYFVFDAKSGGLSMIDLDLEKGGGKDCDSVLRELQATYGPSETGRRSPIVREFNWRSEGTGNLVHLLAVGRDSCFLSYRPLPRPGGAGL